MIAEGEWALVAEVLRTGPADGQQILGHAQSNNLWEDLYLASRLSPYAVAWRQAFGRQRASHNGIQSVLELAVAELRSHAESSLDNGENAQTAVYTAKLIANCCVDDNHNRRLSIKAGVLLPLMNLLLRGADPNILVPAIYNICADLEDPAENLVPDASSPDGSIQPTLAEERLATTDGSAKSVFSGIFTFLSPPVVFGCRDEIKEYLAEILDMAARPSAVSNHVSQTALSNALDRMLSSDGGRLLAEYSAKSRISIVRALLAVAQSAQAKAFLASSGTIVELAYMAESMNVSEEYFGEDEEERQESAEALEGLKTAMLRLVYEVCSLPQFSTPAKYGIARQSLELIHDSSDTTTFMRTIAYITLYGFIDSNARAHLLASEHVIPRLIQTLRLESDKTVIHPALGLATRLAVTWSLRGELHKQSAMQAVQRVLTAANMGYEIPLNAVTFLELLSKGHPEHVKTLLVTSENGRSIVDDLWALFDKGNDTICLEVGRLFIEICATLAQQNSSEIASGGFELNSFLAACNQRAFARVLVFMGTKAQGAETAIAQRVWFAMGLLSTTEQGKQIALIALQDEDLQLKIKALHSEVGSWSGENVKFMLYNLGLSINQICPPPEDDLDTAMHQMSLG